MKFKPYSYAIIKLFRAERQIAVKSSIIPTAILRNLYEFTLSERIK